MLEIRITAGFYEKPNNCDFSSSQRKFPKKFKLSLAVKYKFGDVPKWLKGPDSKSGRSVLPALGFKSLHLRQHLSKDCLCSDVLFYWELLSNSHIFYKVTAFSKALSENPFDVASRCEYVFAVVEKSLCPSHTCISFNVIPSCLPLLSNNEAQV